MAAKDWTGNVLVVEDDPDIASVYLDHIKDAGGRGWLAETAAAAKQLIREVAFGVGLVDLCLSRDDDSNRDGLLVLEAVARSEDGTRATFNYGAW